MRFRTPISAAEDSFHYELQRSAAAAVALAADMASPLLIRLGGSNSLLAFVLAEDYVVETKNKNKMAARATQPSPGALPSSQQQYTAEGKIDERLNRFT